MRLFRFKFKISTKILFSLSFLSILSLIIFGHIAYEAMQDLGRDALDSSVSLGEQAVNDSIYALQGQAEQRLVRLADDQAALSRSFLERVETEVSIVADFAQNLWAKPYLHRYKRSYSQEEKPSDIYSTSVYTLAPGVSFRAVKNELSLSSVMDGVFIPIYSSNKNIDTICMGTETGIFRSYPWRSGRDPSYDPRKRNWYRKAVEQRSTIWTEPYIHAATKELIITCAKPFFSKDKEVLGVVEIDVTLKVLQDKIISTQVGKLGYVFLLDSKGNIIARPGLLPNDTRWDQTYATENLLESANKEVRRVAEDMVGGKTGIQQADFDDEKKYIAYAPIKGTDWSLAVVMPLDEIIGPALATESKIASVTETTSQHISKKIKNILTMIDGVFIGVIIIVLLIAYFMSKKITRPIYALNKGAKIVGSGDLDYNLDVKTGDEIEDLANSFNAMTSNLKDYINKLTTTTAVKERMEKELKIARDIQMSIIPKKFPPFPRRKEFDIYAVLRPAREVGGDFYDFFFIDEDNICFLIGDVSGKGVGASLFMAMTVSAIKIISSQLKKPDRILAKLNEQIVKDKDFPMFVTIFCGILNIKTGELLYASGGHNPPLIIKKSGAIDYLESSDGMVVGAFAEAVFKSERLQLNAGDTIYMYTDGVTEAVDHNGEFYSDKRLKECLAFLRGNSVKDLVLNSLRDIVHFFRGVPQSDDITIVVLRYNKEKI